MIACGLAVSSIGTVWALYVGHGLLLGLLGNGAMFPPLLVYVSRWFERRRGTALALIASGQYIAGHDLAERLRARDGALGLAGDDDRLRDLRARRDPADRGAVPAPGAGSSRSLPKPRCTGSAPQRLGAGPVAQSGARPALYRRVLLLRADGACRRAIWSRSAAISASRRRRARRCCRCCRLAPFAAGSSGAGSPTGSAGW